MSYSGVSAVSRRGRVRDKWRNKKWFTVIAPEYFGGSEIGSVVTDDPEKLIGRTVESTLYDITEDFAHQYLKMYFQINRVEGKRAFTTFKGHEYARDYLRSLVRRRTTRIDCITNVTTKDGYTLRVSAVAFTLVRVKTSQERGVRAVMKKILEEKASMLSFKEFVQEAVLGKIASDIYNEAKKIVPLRHVGVRKSKVISRPQVEAEEKQEEAAGEEEQVKAEK